MKWADYVVTRVQYDEDGSRIAAYEVREDMVRISADGEREDRRIVNSRIGAS